ncbi:uncharacterized protein I206_103111 [Kwoniella pini CBS 10737]|uniref:Uncharacterized protein n=1 Tax=Kwoniella pini CBS 10737 TaxID=1296096 RepID=A0A1B9IAE2_9TREE|nr:uncharacterized protein I206_01885 [Kwoniella pini CBS 10737]OCF52592.1 hypothetical protein I206_01885 [Kwoniella pini CBS 10737]
MIYDLFQSPSIGQSSTKPINSPIKPDPMPMTIPIQGKYNSKRSKYNNVNQIHSNFPNENHHFHTYSQYQPDLKDDKNREFEYDYHNFIEGNEISENHHGLM